MRHEFRHKVLRPGRLPRSLPGRIILPQLRRLVDRRPKVPLISRVFVLPQQRLDPINTLLAQDKIAAVEVRPKSLKDTNIRHSGALPTVGLTNVAHGFWEAGRVPGIDEEFLRDLRGFGIGARVEFAGRGGGDEVAHCLELQRQKPLVSAARSGIVNAYFNNMLRNPLILSLTFCFVRQTPRAKVEVR